MPGEGGWRGRVHRVRGRPGVLAVLRCGVLGGRGWRGASALPTDGQMPVARPACGLLTRPCAAPHSCAQVCTEVNPRLTIRRARFSGARRPARAASASAACSIPRHSAHRWMDATILSSHFCSPDQRGRGPRVAGHRTLLPQLYSFILHLPPIHPRSPDPRGRGPRGAQPGAAQRARGGGGGRAPGDRPAHRGVLHAPAGGRPTEARRSRACRLLGVHGPGLFGLAGCGGARRREAWQSRARQRCEGVR